MTANAPAHPNGTGYAGVTVTKAPDWHGLVAWDILFNNLTTGLFLTLATGELMAPLVFAPLAKFAYPIALVFLFVDLACLVLDLGDPLRFHHMLRVFKPSSPMSLGTWCLTAYSLPLTLIVVLGLLPIETPALEWVRKVAVILGILPALGAALYKGVLLSTNAQPGWRDARWLGGYLSNSALMLGCAELLVLAVLQKEDAATSLLRRALAVLLILNTLFLTLLIADLRASLARLFTAPQLWRIGLLALGGGMFIPLCLMLAGGSLLLIAVLLVVLGSLAIRYVIVSFPHRS